MKGSANCQSQVKTMYIGVTLNIIIVCILYQLPASSKHGSGSYSFLFAVPLLGDRYSMFSTGAIVNLFDTYFVFRLLF